MNEFMKRYTEREDIEGVLRYVQTEQIERTNFGAEEIIFIISNNPHVKSETIHFNRNGIKTIEMLISFSELEQWIISGRNRRIISWLLESEIVYDISGSIAEFVHRLNSFPVEMRKKRMMIEYSQFLRRYYESKNYLQSGHVFDSYSSMLRSLHHWGRLTVIESGSHPELTVWSQVRMSNPAVYKVYDQLINGTEELDKRIELAMLACEFSIQSKLYECSQLLFEVMKDKQEAWTYEELISHTQLKGMPIELEMLLTKLVRRQIVAEVIIPIDAQYQQVKYLLQNVHFGNNSVLTM